MIARLTRPLELWQSVYLKRMVRKYPDQLESCLHLVRHPCDLDVRLGLIRIAIQATPGPDRILPRSGITR